MNWLEEAADRVPLALVWLAAVAVGFLIYFVPIVGLLDGLAEIAKARSRRKCLFAIALAALVTMGTVHD